MHSEKSSLSVLTGVYFFLILIDFNNFMGDALGFDMRSLLSGIFFGFMVPLGIAHLMAIVTHKIVKFMKPTFEFSLESATTGIAEKLYLYALGALVIADIYIWGKFIF